MPTTARRASLRNTVVVSGGSQAKSIRGAACCTTTLVVRPPEAREKRLRGTLLAVTCERDRANGFHGSDGTHSSRPRSFRCRAARSSSVIRSTSSSSSSASLSEGRRYGLSAPGLQRNESDETMKKKTTRSGSPGNDDLRREYRFDYSRTKPNRFAPQFAAGSVAVVLDPDVASVFRTSESVNVLLRSVLAAMPRMAQRGAARRRRGSKRVAADGREWQAWRSQLNAVFSHHLASDAGCAGLSVGPERLFQGRGRRDTGL